MRGAGIRQFGRRTAGVVNEEAVAGVVAGGGGVRLAGGGKCGCSALLSKTSWAGESSDHHEAIEFGTLRSRTLG
jgi:hypothetical protein